MPGRPLQPWEREALRAVGDDLMRDIVNDFRRGIPSCGGSMIPQQQKPAEPEKPVNRTPGWQEAIPLERAQSWGVDWAQRDAERKAREQREAAEREAEAERKEAERKGR
jgi:hypothetical protein